jgi:hypothetical protein
MVAKIITLMLIASCMFASQKHVTTTGASGHTGADEANAWSLSEAQAAVAPGDTVNLHTGTYGEMRLEIAGTVGSPIVWRHHGNDVVTIAGGASDDSYKACLILADYNHVVGLRILDAEIAENGTAFSSGELYTVEISGNNILLDSCRIYNPANIVTYNDTDGGRVRGVTVTGRFNTVSNCLIRGMSTAGIITNAGTSATPNNNIIRKDTIYATYYIGIILGGSTLESPGLIGNLVENCVIDTSIGEDAIQLDHDPYDWSANRGYIIRYNYMANCGENAIDSKHSGHAYVYGNIIHSSDGDDNGPYISSGWGSGPIIAKGNYGSESAYMIIRDNIIWDGSGGVSASDFGEHVVNNTIVNNRRKLGTSNVVDSTEQSFSGVYNSLIGNAYSRSILNNIIAGGCTYFQNWKNNGSTNFTVDYNIYYDTTSEQVSTNARFIHRTHDGGTDGTDGDQKKVRGITAWKTALLDDTDYGSVEGREVNSQWADPLFVSGDMRAADGTSSTWDWTLQAGSPAKGTARCWTFANGGGVSSLQITVDDAYYFHDGMEVTGGDSIKVGSNSATLIETISYSTNTIQTVGAEMTWSDNDSVWLWSNGSVKRNIGATISAITSEPSVVTIPDTTTHVSPVDESTASSPVTFRWRKVTDAIKYYFDCSTNGWEVSSFYSDPNVTDTSITVSGFSEGDIVSWNVAAGNSSGWSAFTTPWHTTITASYSATKDTLSWLKVSDTLTVSGNTGIYFSDVQRRDFVLLVKNPSGYSVTFDPAIKWPLTGPPAMSNDTNALIFFYRDIQTVYGILFGVYAH